jgi:hypothetical protein
MEMMGLAMIAMLAIGIYAVSFFANSPLFSNLEMIVITVIAMSSIGIYAVSFIAATAQLQ